MDTTNKNKRYNNITLGFICYLLERSTDEIKIKDMPKETVYKYYYLYKKKYPKGLTNGFNLLTRDELLGIIKRNKECI